MTKRKSCKMEIELDYEEEPDWSALSVIPMQQTSQKKYCSSVWEYFGQLMRATTCLDTKNFYCLPCFEIHKLKQYSATTATSNFYTHLRVFHNITPERHTNRNFKKEKITTTAEIPATIDDNSQLNEMISGTDDPLSEMLVINQHLGRPLSKNKKLQLQQQQQQIQQHLEEQQQQQQLLPSPQLLQTTEVTTAAQPIIEDDNDEDIREDSSSSPSNYINPINQLSIEKREEYPSGQVHLFTAKQFRLEEAICNEDYDKLFILSLVTEFRKVPDEYRLDAKADLLGVLRKYRYIAKPECLGGYHHQTENPNSNSGFLSQSQTNVDY